ncbi:mate-domain-containing protein [Tribonema minus]|uniref:Mate-domain-containing protein n=1 Tax=Tribonema minus TaxID=303371 RepID=A0A835YXE7_9STRA|nr:mate-domain-containing protein [Tribonema minus]
MAKGPCDAVEAQTPDTTMELKACVALFLWALTHSTTSLVSKNLAQGNPEAAGEVAQQSMLLALVLGLGVGALLLTRARPMLSLMGAGPGSVLYNDAHSYLTTRALAAPAVLLLTVCEGLFRGHGNTRTPAIASLLAAVANLILDPILMFKCGLGVRGAAQATVCAQYLALATYAGFIARDVRAGRMRLPALAKALGRKEEPAPGGAGGGEGRAGGAPRGLELLRVVLFANAAMLVRTVSLMACWAAATSVATRMGTVHVGAHQVALSVWLLLALVAEAPSIAAQVLGARYLGRGELRAARAMAARVVALTVASGALLGAALAAARGALPAAFTRDPALAARIGALVPLLALQQPLVAATLLMEGLLVGAQQFRWLGATTLVTTSVGTAAVLAVGRLRPEAGVVGVWWGITGMFVGRFLGAAWRLLDRKRGPYWVPERGVGGEGDEGGVEGRVEGS